MPFMYFFGGWEGQQAGVGGGGKQRRYIMANQCPIANSTGLLDFAVGLVKYVFSLPDGQVKFLGEFKLQKNCI